MNKIENMDKDFYTWIGKVSICLENIVKGYLTEEYRKEQAIKLYMEYQALCNKYFRKNEE